MMEEQTETDEEQSAASGTEPVETDDRLLAIVESVLFAAGEPLTMARLAEAVPGPSRPELRAALRLLGERCEATGRGIRLVEVAGGFQLRTAPDYAQWVRRLFQQKPWRLTRATLETLAIVAYKQPITRAEIEVIRGVDVDSVLASLLSRKLVRIVGRKDVVGRPLIYGTTRQFLEVFGLRDLASLPALSEVVQPMPDGVAAGAASVGEVSDGEGDGEETADEVEGLADGAAEGAGDTAEPTDGAAAAGRGAAAGADDTEETTGDTAGAPAGAAGRAAAAADGGRGAVLAPGGGAADPTGTRDGERNDGRGPGDAGGAD
jgi:segregation and condensation protein B